MQLQAEIKNMVRNNHKETEIIATNVLRKVFTPGQIKIIMSSTNSRVK